VILKFKETSDDRLVATVATAALVSLNRLTIETSCSPAVTRLPRVLAAVVLSQTQQIMFSLAALAHSFAAPKSRFRRHIRRGTPSRAHMVAQSSPNLIPCHNHYDRIWSSSHSFVLHRFLPSNTNDEGNIEIRVRGLRTFELKLYCCSRKSRFLWFQSVSRD
jgi:hypothetical protein